ncbi:MAG: TylF/MycF/NovP-related O-methyltransferase [Actinomycetota bacterium]
MASDRTPEQAAQLADRRDYVATSRGDQFRPRGFYFRTFSTWHAGDRLRNLPIGIRQLGMALRNWRVFWRPKALEFRYMSDGYATKSQLAFLDDEKFKSSYDRMLLATGFPVDPGIHLRIHQAMWAASIAKHLEGDFVECGTGRGMVFSAVLESLPEWSQLGKTLWLFDTFSPYFLDPVTGKPDMSRGVRSLYARDMESTERNFAEWPRVRCIAGELPESLSQAEIKNIALLHIDLNHAPVEQQVLRRLWPLMTKGGIVFLDDYGQNKEQNAAMNEVARELDFQILTTGSAQGIIIKS